MQAHSSQLALPSRTAPCVFKGIKSEQPILANVKETFPSSPLHEVSVPHGHLAELEIRVEHMIRL